MTQLATFGGGCFWCTEAVFQQLAGVASVTSGYAGGDTPEPTYEQICTGATGHAEVVQIEFDETVISFEKLLSVFFTTHDPTTLNRQGADRGTQYRSVVFYHDKTQKQTAEKIIGELDAAGAWSAPIVTEVSPLPEFFSAEAYHQDYFARNPSQPYCQAVIRPKMEKLQAVFSEYLK